MPGPQPCHCIPFIFLHRREGACPLRGVGDAAPYNNPQGFSLPQTSAAAWGQAALHPTLPHSVGRAFARNSFTPPRRGRACPAHSLAIVSPLSFCIVGRGLDPSAAFRRRPVTPLPPNPLLTPPPPSPFPKTLQTLHALHKTCPLFAKPLPRLYRTMVETGAKPRYN